MLVVDLYTGRRFPSTTKSWRSPSMSVLNIFYTTPSESSETLWLSPHHSARSLQSDVSAMTQAAVNDDDEEGTGRVDWNSASRPDEILILIYYRDSTVLMIRQYISPSGTSTFYYTILIHHGKVCLSSPSSFLRSPIKISYCRGRWGREA